MFEMGKIKSFRGWLINVGVVTIVASVWTHLVFAEESYPPQTISGKAKAKWYPGGADEEPLKVQKKLPDPKSKVSIYYIQKKVLNDVLKQKKKINK